MLNACVDPLVDCTGQRHLLESTRLQVDFAHLQAVWFREDMAEAQEWAQRGEAGELARSKSGMGSPPHKRWGRPGCFACTAHMLAPHVVKACTYHGYEPALDDAW